MIGAGTAQADGDGDRRAAPLPTGTVTFLLTDVEGWSRRWESQPAAMAAALRRHEEIVDAYVGLHRGGRPDEQGEGNSCVAAFARSSDAISCAVELQRALTAEAWPRGAELKVRIGLHTGEAELRDSNYRGAVLSRCARLRSLGHGGQILLSQATYELAADRLPDAVTVRDLGQHRLRDLTRPEHVWQVCHPELAHEFPPLRSLDAVPNNLPVQLTTFVGRVAEMQLVRGLLGESRLLTLTGAGGCGKTRLAVQVAADILEDQPDGLWWVDLAPLADPDLVPGAAAAAVGVREIPGEAIGDTLVLQLGTRRLMLVLDNCEHVVAVCAGLAERLLQHCPAVRILATSREPLGVDGETTWRVPSLSLPTAASPTTDSVSQCEAVTLFIDRAVRTRPNFRVTNENAPAVAEICHRLDGIPLAIELAASRTRMLTPQQIVEGLHDRFHLLTGGARTALPRQRTLEASVDWSYNLLDDDERAAFRRLAVFAGSFSLDAAEAVCADGNLDGQQVLDLLTRLVDRSLIQVDDEGPRARYRLLETLRHYARGKLVDSNEVEACHDRHADFYLAVAEDACPHLDGPSALNWFDRLDTELDNLRAAMDWSAHSLAHDPVRGLSIAGALHRYWEARTYLLEGRTRIEAALSASCDEGAVRSRALVALADVASLSGEMDRAREAAQEALAIGRRLGSDQTVGRALYYLGRTGVFSEPDPTIAPGLLEEAIDALDRADDGTFRASALVTLGFAYATTAQSRRARQLYVDGLALARQEGFRVPLKHGLAWLAWLDIFEGRFDNARRCLDEALEIIVEQKDAFFEAVVRAPLGEVELCQGNYEAARKQLRLGMAAVPEPSNVYGRAVVGRVLGRLEYAEGHLDAAALRLEQAHGFLRDMHIRDAARCKAILAHVELARARPEDARKAAHEALELGRATDYAWAIGVALEAEAALAQGEGEPDRAEDLLHDALTLAVDTGRVPGVCDALEALAAGTAAQGRHQEAARLLGAAQALRDSIGYIRFPVCVAQHEACIELVTSALGDDAFHAAWAEGAALSTDDAVVYARRGRGGRKRPAHGWRSLTPTERQVVDLVAEGLTNPQIGDCLFISKRTVGTHLAHVFTKLGVSTRAELAARAAEYRANA